MNEIASGLRPKHFFAVRTFRIGLVCSALCIAAFVYFVTDGSFDFFEEEDFGNFFDYQALAILERRLDVPEFAIGGEAFVVSGKYYGYFGVAPSLLRIPFVFFENMPGRLSRILMVFYYCIVLICSLQILRLTTKSASGADTEPSSWSIVAFVFSVGLGSTVLFLGSKAFVYHEAILAGIAFTVMSNMCAMQWMAHSSKNWWIGAAICALLAVHSRPSVGLYAATFLGCVAAWRCFGSFEKRIPRRLSCPKVSERKQFWVSLFVGALAILAPLSFAGLSYLKFGTTEGAPLRYHVQIASKPERLANISEGNFYLENIPFNLDGYLTGRHFSLESYFPFFFARDDLVASWAVSSGWQPPPTDAVWREVAHSRIDWAEPTVAIPYSMPALFIFSIAGGVCALIFVPGLRSVLALTWLSVFPMGTALLLTVFISHRYTGDFVPFLTLASAVGMAALAKITGQNPKLLIILIIGLVSLSVCISAALTLNYQSHGIWW